MTDEFRPANEHPDFGKVCLHGQLKRKCYTCELEEEIERLHMEASKGYYTPTKQKEIFVLRAQNQMLRAALKEAEKVIRRQGDNGWKFGQRFLEMVKNLLGE